MAALPLADLAHVAERRRARVAVLSSFTIDPIRPYLEVGCLERDILPDVFIPGFNQFSQQLLASGSELYAFRPDLCFLHVLPEALVPGFAASGLASVQVKPLLESVRELILTFRRQCQADLVVSNFAVPARFPYLLQRDEEVHAYRELNDGLQQLVAGMAGVHVLDYDDLTAFHGKGAVADERLRHLARMEIGESLLPKLASRMLAHLVALRGLGRKCIVLDLDNTLWGGTVGEDGPPGIELGAAYPGSAFVEFQHALLALYRRGIVLAVNSKNNEEDALEVLEHHPAMILRPEHFAVMRINWKDKCENIEAMARELRLGLDSMVFVDDSPVERDLMRRLRPEVLTPEWPTDPVLYRRALESLCDFATLSLTSEDERRGGMYAAESEREGFKKRSGTIEEYLFGLRMEVWINEAVPTDVPRVYQLVQKTNQFNLTTRRHSSAQIEAFLSSDRAAVYVLRNRDAFGDNGLVGIAVLINEEGAAAPTWRIDSLLMSCRVLGRTIEQCFLHHLVSEAQKRDARFVIGEFIPTSKNALVQNFYRDSGFSCVESVEAGSRWLLDLAVYTPPSLPWLRVNPPTDAPADSQSRVQDVAAR